MFLWIEMRGPNTSGDRHQRGRCDSQTEEVACAKAQVTEHREGGSAGTANSSWGTAARQVARRPPSLDGEVGLAEGSHAKALGVIPSENNSGKGHLPGG